MRHVPLDIARWTILFGIGVFSFFGGCSKKIGDEQIVAEIGRDDVTYHQQVAQIMQSECSECHRPGGGGPFSLLTFDDVSSRAQQIADVVESGYMPPWPPDATANSFIDERILTAAEKDILRRWADGGAPKGNAINTSFQSEQRTDEWTLGEPDLVVSFDAPFEVPTSEDDIYRNFVIPIPVTESKFVNAIEIRPSNLRVAHHLFVRIDRTGAAMALSGKDGRPGFGGMGTPAGVHAPQGCILSWQVGKQPSPEPEGIAWQLHPDSHFVIECHLQPTGKKENLDIQIGFALYRNTSNSFGRIG